MVKIEISAENVMKCLCKLVPVQATSECVKGNKKIQEMMAEDIDLASMIGPEDVPMLYFV